MSREARGPALLVVAGALTLFAMISYMIGDFNERTQKQEAMVREQTASRAQDARLTQERARLDSRNDREAQERGALRDQLNAIIQLLQRIENAVVPRR